ncbi:MAG: SGNH/GDSL hydrolase family protein [Desulfatiglandaceae bacterium]
MKSKLAIISIYLNIIIVLLAILCLSILISGGFSWHINGIKLSFNSLINPLVALLIAFICRFILSIGAANGLILITSILIALFVGEIALRIIAPPMALPQLKSLFQPDTELGYRMIPLLEDKNIRTNSHGLRDKERDWEKPEGVLRLLGLGDSFTFGYEVSSSDSYIKQLESLLNQNGEKWDVINAGVTGYNMWQYLTYFENIGYRYAPDLITIGIYFDDFFGEPSSGSNEVKSERRYRSFSFIRLANFCRNLADIIKFRYRYLYDRKWLRSVDERQDFISENKKYRDLLRGKADPEVYKKFESRLKRIVSLAGEKDIPVLVIFIPDIAQLHNPELQKINRIISEICIRTKTEFIDITNVFEEVDDVRHLYLLPHDAHTSTYGHEIIAKETYKIIKKLFEDIFIVNQRSDEQGALSTGVYVA